MTDGQANKTSVSISGDGVRYSFLADLGALDLENETRELEPGDDGYTPDYPTRVPTGNVTARLQAEYHGPGGGIVREQLDAPWRPAILTRLYAELRRLRELARANKPD